MQTCAAARALRARLHRAESTLNLPYPLSISHLHRDDGRVQHALVELGVVIALDRVPHAPHGDLRPRHLRARRRWPAVPLREKQAGSARPACTQLTAGAGGAATGDKLAAPARPCTHAHSRLVDL